MAYFYTMKIKRLHSFTLPLLFIWFITTSFNNDTASKKAILISKVLNNTVFIYPQPFDEVSESLRLVYIQKKFVAPIIDHSFYGFKEAIAYKESTGNYCSVNSFGYLGKYQFGPSTLDLLGIENTNDFLDNPQLQELAFMANTMRNKWVLRRDIKRFVGQEINGIKITESGILAAAHLSGPGHVKRYLRTYGLEGFSDGFGTDLSTYLDMFSGYDTSIVRAVKAPKVETSELNLFEL